jgi:hypothetical protein
VYRKKKTGKMTSALIKTYLGNTTPLDPADFSEQLWVQVERKKRDASYVVIGKRDRLTASPYSMSSLELGSLQIPASAFTPTTDTTTYNIEGGWWGTRIVLNSGTGNFVAPVQLPHGATIQSMTYYHDLMPDSTAYLVMLTLILCVRPPVNTMASVTSSEVRWDLHNSHRIQSLTTLNQYNSHPAAR